MCPSEHAGSRVTVVFCRALVEDRHATLIVSGFPSGSFADQTYGFGGT
jgi:hypothetical protein